jgi:hypothetical protein
VRILNVCVDIEDSDSKIVSSLHSIGKEREYQTTSNSICLEITYMVVIEREKVD